MATAVATLKVNPFPAGIDNTQHLTYVRGQVFIGNGTYRAGGLALDWTSLVGILSGIKVAPEVQGIYSTPIQVTFWSAGTTYYQGGPSSVYAGGFPFLWNKLNNTLQILANAGTQVAGSGPVTFEMTDLTPVPQQVVVDTILFEAVFVRSYS